MSCCSMKQCVKSGPGTCCKALGSKSIAPAHPPATAVQLAVCCKAWRKTISGVPVHSPVKKHHSAAEICPSLLELLRRMVCRWRAAASSLYAAESHMLDSGRFSAATASCCRRSCQAAWLTAAS